MHLYPAAKRQTFLSALTALIPWDLFFLPGGRCSTERCFCSTGQSRPIARGMKNHPRASGLLSPSDTERKMSEVVLC